MTASDFIRKAEKSLTPEEKEEWKYWSKKKSLRLMEAFYLQRGFLQPRHETQLSEKQIALGINAREELEGESQYHTLLESLRVDEEDGNIWRTRKSHNETAETFITKEIFIGIMQPLANSSCDIVGVCPI